MTEAIDYNQIRVQALIDALRNQRNEAADRAAELEATIVGLNAMHNAMAGEFSEKNEGEKNTPDENLGNPDP